MEERYEAFVSYSHSEGDSRVAWEIQRFIEGFSIPAPLRSKAGRARLGKVFRDEDDLSASQELAHDLKAALDRSDWLIVVCSPAAAASPWVAREVEYFVSRHGMERVLTALSNGEPKDAFPSVLLAREGVSGEAEPIAADLRRSSTGGKRRAEMLRLVAPLIGCPYDELAQKRRMRRRRRIAVAAAAAAVCVAAVGSLLLYQHSRVVDAEQLAAAERSRGASEEAYSEGDRIEAIRLALEGAVGDGVPAHEAASRSALSRALGVYHPVVDAKPLYALHSTADASMLAVSEEGSWIALLDSEGSIVVRDLGTGSVLCEAGEDVLDGALFASAPLAVHDRLLVWLSDGGLACLDTEGGDVAWRLGNIGSAGCIEELSKGRAVTLDLSGRSAAFLVIDLSSGEIEQRLEVPGIASEDSGGAVAMAANGEVVATATGSSVAVADLSAGSVRSADLGASGATSLELDGSGLYVMRSSLSSAAGADDSWTGQMELVAYDLATFEPLWSLERTWDPYQLDFSPLPFNTDALIWEIARPESLGTDVLAITAGSHALLVDTATGEVLVDAATEAPIVHLDLVSDGAVMRAVDVTGSRYMAWTAPGATLASMDGYRFPQEVWHAEEVYGEGCRYAIGCAAEETDMVYVYRDDLALPLEPGVRKVDVGFEPTGFTVSGDRSRVALFDGASRICVLAGETFDVRTVIDLGALGVEVADAQGSLMRFPENDRGSLIFADNGGGASAPGIWCVDAETGELTGSWEWPYAAEGEQAGISYDGSLFSSERAGLLTLSIPSAGYLALIDPASLETVQEFSPGEAGIVDIMRVNEDRYLIVNEYGVAGLYDVASMDLVGEGFEGTTFEAELGAAQVAIAPDGSDVAAVCPERGLIVVDAESGSVVWSEQIASGGSEFVGFSDDGGYVFAQDLEGAFWCFDAKTGDVIARTDEVGASVVECDLSASGELYVRTFDTVTYALEVLALDPDAGELIPVADVPMGWTASQEGDAVLVGAPTLYRQPLYTLDELVSIAEETIADFGGSDPD